MTQAGWTVAGLASWIAVVVFFIPGMMQEHFLAKRRESKLKKQRERRLLENDPDL